MKKLSENKLMNKLLNFKIKVAKRQKSKEGTTLLTSNKIRIDDRALKILKS